MRNILNALNVLDRLAGKWFDWRTDRAVRADPQLQSLGLHKAEVNTNGWEIVYTAPELVFLVEQASALLDKQNAKNYIQFDMLPRLDRGLKPIRVTVQWANGESPAAKCARLEAENTRGRGFLIRITYRLGQARQAIETAITSEDGLDGGQGEDLLTLIDDDLRRVSAALESDTPVKEG